jgi:hypothetical protein
MSMTTRFGAAEHIDPIGPAAKRTTVIGIMYLAPPLPGVGPIFFDALVSQTGITREGEILLKVCSEGIAQALSHEFGRVAARAVTAA